MTKQDILDNLNTFRKVSNNNSSNNYNDNKWIGTYNFRQMIFNKFFKLLYNPDEPISKNRKTPVCMLGIKKLPRKLQSRYNTSNIWDSRDLILAEMSLQNVSTIHQHTFLKFFLF